MADKKRLLENRIELERKHIRDLDSEILDLEEYPMVRRYISTCMEKSNAIKNANSLIKKKQNLVFDILFWDGV